MENMLAWKKPDDRPLVAVHRGYQGGNILPNTVESVRAAIAVADIAEIDVSYADGQCYVFHDSEEAPMFGFLNDLEDLRADAIARLRYTNRYGCLTGHPVNTLDEILDAVGDGYVNIDRCWQSPAKAAAVVAAVKAHGMTRQALLKAPPKFAGLFPEDVAFMPIVSSVDELREAEAARRADAVEILFATPEAAEPILAYCKGKAYPTWVNTIVLNDTAVLSGGLDDAGGLFDPAAHWGRLYRMGFTILQTDFPADVLRYFGGK